MCLKKVSVYVQKEIVVNLEDPGIDPGTSRMLSGLSTIWANHPLPRSEYKLLGKT